MRFRIAHLLGLMTLLAGVSYLLAPILRRGIGPYLAIFIGCMLAGAVGLGWWEYANHRGRYCLAPVFLIVAWGFSNSLFLGFIAVGVALIQSYVGWRAFLRDMDAR